MIDLGAHAEYIVWGYIGVVVVTAVLIGLVIRDSRKVAARLKALESQGIRRRSAGPAS